MIIAKGLTMLDKNFFTGCKVIYYSQKLATISNSKKTRNLYIQIGQDRQKLGGI